MLLAVDKARVAPAAQMLYSARDDLKYFLGVTHELYRAAVARELPPAASAEAVERALAQVFGARHAAESDCELRAVVDGLVHVRCDRAAPCPLAPGDLLPRGLVLTASGDGADTTVDAIVHVAAGGRPTVLLAGSHS